MFNNDKTTYTTEQLTLMLGDCLERMKEIKSGGIDLILTDTPYIDYPKILWYNVINTLKGWIC